MRRTGLMLCIDVISKDPDCVKNVTPEDGVTSPERRYNMISVTTQVEFMIAPCQDLEGGHSPM